MLYLVSLFLILMIVSMAIIMLWELFGIGINAYYFVIDLYEKMFGWLL